MKLSAKLVEEIRTGFSKNKLEIAISCIADLGHQWAWSPHESVTFTRWVPMPVPEGEKNENRKIVFHEVKPSPPSSPPACVHSKYIKPERAKVMYIVFTARTRNEMIRRLRSDVKVL